MSESRHKSSNSATGILVRTPFALCNHRCQEVLQVVGVDFEQESLSGTLPFQDAKAVMQGQYRLQKIPSKWVNVSFQAQELVDRMICRDVNRRITIKKILEYPWIKDDDMQNKARRLMGKRVVMRNRKYSVPGSEHPKSSDLKPPIDGANRRFSWFKSNPKLGNPSSESHDKKPEAAAVNVNFKRHGSARQPAQPRGVMQFMRKENIAIQDKVVTPIKPVNPPKVPLMTYYQSSPEYKGQKKVENTILNQARNNLKPVNKS